MLLPQPLTGDPWTRWPVSFLSFSDTRRRRLTGHEWLTTELRFECGNDLKVAQQERPLVESPAAQPAGDLVVALAGVARSASRHHIVEGVAAPAGDRQHTVALQTTLGRPAVRAPTPGCLERHPLLRREIVLDPLHPATPASSGTFPATPADSHPATVGRAAGLPAAFPDGWTRRVFAATLGAADCPDRGTGGMARAGTLPLLCHVVRLVA